MLDNTKKEYKKFLKDIEKNLKNKDDIEYVKNRFEAFFDTVLNEVNNIANTNNDKINKLEEMQKQIEAKVTKMQQIIDNIESDIYEDSGFDFEITCPYCNYDFIIDVDENKTEIECPECKNIIELDWSGDVDDKQDGCNNGNCGGCSHNCNPEDDDM